MTDDRQAVERLIASLDTAWARFCQEQMERRAAAAEYDATCRKLGIIPMKPFNPE